MELFLTQDILIYLAIFFGKIIEVSLDTLRIVLIGRGKRVAGAILGFFVVIIWIVIISSVLDDLSENIIKIIVYAVAYALGNYVGVTLENKLAIGLCSIMVITRQAEGYLIANKLRESGFGVTILDGESANYRRSVLVIHLKRKCINEAVKLINTVSTDAVITINDIKNVYGGYVKKR